LLKPLYTGLRKTIRPGDFASLKTPCPKADEQDAIVRFLDHTNGRIERAIRAKKKLIALLNEQRQAIIHRAVTRGLDPGVPLKPSGIPWLGDIPKHWEVWPLRRCISIRSGEFADPLHLRAERSEYHCIPVVGANGVIGFSDRANNRGATIVIGRVGSCGSVHLISADAWVTDNALRITRLSGFVVGYLAEQLRVMNLNRLANANAQPLITGGIIKSQRVVKPPPAEQSQIADRLPGLVAPTNTAIARTEREIGLLREYRARLVADVVTGKLDVRAAADNLPDADEPATSVPEESEEAELIEEEQFA
jgi:type I restriction enzyme, S subunit